MANKRGSLQALPVNWMPVGWLWGPKPLGIDNAGCPARLPAWMIGGPKPNYRYDSLKLRAIGYETVVRDGDTRASYFA